MAEQIETLISIIIVNYNCGNILIDCLKSVEEFTQTLLSEIIVVDNASVDGSVALVEKQFPQITLIKETENRGFGAGNNIGAKVAKGNFLFFLNPDTVLTQEILPHLLNIIQSEPTVGIVAPKLVYPDGSLQISTAEAIGIKGEYQTRKRLLNYQQGKNIEAITKEFQEIKTVDIVIGAAFLISEELFHQLSGFDEEFFLYFEESDLCQRVRNLGKNIVYTPQVSLIHKQGYSSKQVSARVLLEYRRSQIYYYQKHLPFWEQIVIRFYIASKFTLLLIKSPDLTKLKVIRLALCMKNHPFIKKQSPINNKQ